MDNSDVGLLLKMLKSNSEKFNMKQKVVMTQHRIKKSQPRMEANN